MSEFREIPYNYTSFSDKEIVCRFLGDEAWDLLNNLRTDRNTGRSARMLFEVLGDMWVVNRNPYIQEDLIKNSQRWTQLVDALNSRVSQIETRANGNKKVLKIIELTNHAIRDFQSCLSEFKKNKKQIESALLKVTNKNNIRFDALSRSSHSTDATDWRVEYPQVVITPDTENEIADIVKTCISLGLTIIPRGGGTGYTGSAIPLHSQTAVINTEKLSSIDDINFDGKLHSIRVGAGVITRRVSEKAQTKNLVFAVDPTSQDACTIGGNVAMNAGGKKALRWGTTIDNLLSWKMVMPDGSWRLVRRLNHNQDKIQLLEEVNFEIDYLDTDGKNVLKTEKLSIKTPNLRKTGLGKDVTNKFLGGLPGIQKEGCDGFITSATFVLHEPLKEINTLCLEFFGHDLKAATQAIVTLKDLIDASKTVDLVGMEHLDARYIKAVNYTTKANRSELPKMLLLIDISSKSQKSLDKCIDDVVEVVRDKQGECFIAKLPEKRKIFWKDRSNTAAIASHTNAFKINEDVVIPLDKLSEYNDGIEFINIRTSIENKVQILEKIDHYLSSVNLSSSLIKAKITSSRELVSEVKGNWLNTLKNLKDPEIFRSLQTHKTIISYKKEFIKPAHQILIGDTFQKIRDEIEKIHAKFREERVFIATHMHAGDGNVHTNIPVHSHNPVMLHKAEEIVKEVMDLATSLGGAISGEHGIGLTKYEFLSDNFKKDFEKYKKSIDPNGHFNKGKLTEGSDLRNAYTPSLRLVQQEALILESSEIGEINEMIKSCVRCGKCKPVCTTHVPEANLLYSPRDKIIGTNLISEAFLYEEQTRRGVSFDHFDEYNDIADHCTICHRCEKPCPVNIDFGDVSAKIKNILVKTNNREVNIAAKASMAYLNAKNPTVVRWTKRILIDTSYKLQHVASKVVKKFIKKKPDVTVGKPDFKTEVVTLLDKPLPIDTGTKTIRDLLNINDHGMVPILSNPDKTNEDSTTVFYFPGCGSERLFSQIGLATLALLYNHGTKVVLPPSYLCCGYPQKATGNADTAYKISTDNRVLFHRMANTLNYLDIQHVLTSCGTCIDQLETYGLGDIFHQSDLIDIHEYLLANKVQMKSSNQKFLYHAPCHDPIKSDNSLSVIQNLLGSEVNDNDRCCGEAGTFAVARPDIAKQVKYRKEIEIKNGLVELYGEEDKVEKTTILTTCPACRQGLSRYSDSTGVTPAYPIEILAKEILGDNWLKEFTEKVVIEKVLL